MDECPTISELLEHIQLRKKDKIAKLKEELRVKFTIDRNVGGKRRLEKILKIWIETNGVNATRTKIIQCLINIHEEVIATKYLNFCYSLGKRRGEFTSIFKNVQEENALIDIRVMQCMPLGPPRVGKTCLKKRLLNEKLPSFPSLSTPIITEKQTIHVESAKVSTIEAQRSAWKPIQWEDEVFSLIHRFKSLPQSLYHALRSFNRKKSLTFHILAISLGVLLYTVFYSFKLPIAIFFLLSFIKSLLDFVNTMASNTGIQYSSGFYYVQVIMLVLYYFELYKTWLLLLLFTISVIQIIEIGKFNMLFFLICNFFYCLVCFVLFYLGVRQSDFIFISGLYLLVIGNNRFLVFFQPLLPKLKNEALITLFYAAEFVFLSYKSYAGTFVDCVRICIVFILFYLNNPAWLKWTFEAVFIAIMAISYYFDLSNFSGAEVLQFVAFIRDIYTALVLIVLYRSKRIFDVDDGDSDTSVVKTAMKNVSDIQHNNVNADSTLKIFFTDSGGQPEFQEVLPSLLSGPTVFFLVFNLQKGLSAKYEVQYVDRNCSEFRPYTTKFTVMDALLQCLASISCLGEYSKTRGKKNLGIKPKVYFIGTHRDLVTKAQVRNLDKELKDAVKNTSWYKENMIQFPSDEQDLIFSVNNFDENDVSFIKLRGNIESLSKLKNSAYNIKIPAPWLGLELTLRAHEENVISLSDCSKLAKSQCSISDQEELKNALWFLHNKIGSVRHYQQIPELRDTIITKPQILFKIVTDLLVSTFPLGGGKVNKEFRETGRFTRSELQEIGNIDSTGLTVKQVIALLRYLHILASLKIDSRGNEHYFLPCALSHAPKPDTEQLASKGNLDSAALLIGFKCGYSPKGVFCALISYMLENKHYGIRCYLIEDCIFRDQASLKFGRTGHCLTITYLPKFLHLELREPEHLPSNSASMKEMHTTVWKAISKGLGIVIPRLNYTCEADPVFGFYCVHSSCKNDEPHPAYFLNKRSHNVLTCSSEGRNSFQIADDQKKWFSAVPFHMKALNMLIKICSTFFYLLFKYKMFSAISVIIVFFLLFGQMNFDIYKLPKEIPVVKQTLINHYTVLCNDDATTNLPCELKNLFIQKNSTWILPIRLFFSNNNYAFQDLTANCTFTILASFEDCYPKNCRYPVQIIQNGLINLFNSCPLSNDLCWPILNHIAGFELVHVFNSMLKTVFKLESSPQIENVLYFCYQFYYTFYRFGQDQCTKDVLSSMEKKELDIEEILSILKFVQYTRPELAPALILKSFDNAAQEPYDTNTQFGNILSNLSKKASASNWLIPVIATAKNQSWFETTNISSLSLEKHFPNKIIF